ncbi:hypothetical protein D3C84_1080700 [compost metagenome]
MDKEPFRRRADLSRMQKARLDDAVDRYLGIDITQESRRILPAQLQGCTGQPGAHGRLAHRQAGGYGTGE